MGFEVSRGGHDATEDEAKDRGQTMARVKGTDDLIDDAKSLGASSAFANSLHARGSPFSKRLPLA